MNIKILVGEPPQGIYTRHSKTSQVIESVKKLGEGEYLEISCTEKQAGAIRQAMYRHCPDKKCRVNATETTDLFKCIIHRRDKG